MQKSDFIKQTIDELSEVLQICLKATNLTFRGQHLYKQIIAIIGSWYCYGIASVNGDHKLAIAFFDSYVS